MVEQEAGAALGRAWLAAGTASRSWLSCASEISEVPKQRARLGPAANQSGGEGQDLVAPSVRFDGGCHSRRMSRAGRRCLHDRLGCLRRAMRTRCRTARRAGISTILRRSRQRTRGSVAAARMRIRESSCTGSYSCAGGSEGLVETAGRAIGGWRRASVPHPYGCEGTSITLCIVPYD